MKTTSILIRRIATILLLVAFANNSGAQIDWKLSGNTVTSDSKLGTNNGYDLIFETGNTERIRITDGGFLGVGLASPEFPLDLLGDMRVDGRVYLKQYAAPSADEKSYLFVDKNGRLQSVTLRGGGGGGSLLQELYQVECFPYTNTDGTIVQYPAPSWVSSSGDEESESKIYTGSVCPAKVGIGTSQPLFPLHVAGKVRATRLGLNADPNDNAFLVLNALQDDGLVMTFTANSDSKTAMRISTEDTEDRIIEVTNTAVNKNVFTLNANGEMVLNAAVATNRALTIKDASDADVLRISTAGVIWSTEVNVALKEEFPDYVFDDNYALMPLENLGQYIAENNHLPNVPTAEEVAANGLNLGEMQRIQMEKTEENTLYILQLEERLKKLEEQNAALVKLMEELKN